MKAIRKLNIFLLIIAIICTMVFVVIQAKEDKYGEYDKKIVVVITDVSVNDNKGTIYFNVTNNGKAEVSYIDLDIRITDSSNQSKYVTQSISCSFYYLESSGSENLEASFYTTNTTSWLIGKTKNSLDLDYKINSVTFSNGNTYTNKNASFESSTQGDNSPGNHTHTYSIEKSDQQNHWLECTCGKKNNVENHSGGTATCTEKAKCSVCNQAYGNYAEHTYSTEWVITDTYHYQESTCGCNVKKDYGVHVADAGNFCSTCDKVLGSTTGIIYDISSDGTYYEVIGYNGTAKRINIADTYQNLPVKNIYIGAFANTSITDVIIPNSVESIGNGAFSGCDSLTSVTMGNSVKSIGERAFYVYYGSSLTSVNYLGTIDDWAEIKFGRGEFDEHYYSNPLTYASNFYINNELVTEVKLTTATYISSSAFSHCSSLTSVTIGDSVTSIGYDAFSGCSNLTSITIPDSVTSIVYDAFSGCHSSLYTEKDNIKYLKVNGNAYFIAYSVTNKNLSTYTIQNGTKFLDYNLFRGCGRLGKITIPDSVISIGYEAFSGCSNLTSITIPDSVTIIRSYAFSGCSNLTSIKYRGSQSRWNAISKGENWDYKASNYTINYNYQGE